MFFKSKSYIKLNHNDDLLSEIYTYKNIVFKMLAFEGLKSSCQINLPSLGENPCSNSGDGNGKWGKTRKEAFMEPYKILSSKSYTFASFQTTLMIHDCKKSMDDFIHEFEYKTPVKETILNFPDSAITCMSFDETSGLLVVCSDDAVFLVRWDSILSQWDRIRVSEGEGRILSCSVTFQGNAIFVSVFKSDTIIIYQGISVHPPTEPGPLILESIECLAALEKTKELCTHSKLFFIADVLNIVGVSSGNAVSVKLWELQRETNNLKLITHRTVRNIKTIAACEIEEHDGNIFMIVMSLDGYAEVYLVQPLGFVLLNCMRIENSQSPDDMNTTLNTTLSFQSEFRILCVKFFFSECHSDKTEDPLQEVEDTSVSEDLSSGDAKEFKIPDLDNSLANVSPESRNICPNLMTVIATNQRISFINVKSGETELVVGFEELLKDNSIMVHNAKLAVDGKLNEIVIALQPCLTRVVFCRRFAVTSTTIGCSEGPTCSLMAQDTLNARSVLRKRIRSPPPPPAPRQTNKGFKYPTSRSRNLPNKPAWASKSRSRPIIGSGSKTSSKASIDKPLLSARSQPSVPTQQMQFKVPNDGSFSARPVTIKVSGSYDEEELRFRESQRINLDIRMADELSYMRLATNRDGKLLAVGANVSPLMIMKTQPFENIRLLKDVSRVTSLNFSFNSNLLLLSSNDGKTTMFHWQNKKELLTFDFNSKFNEHIHTQFYFMDKFILQPEENKLVLYSYAKRDTGFIKLQAGNFILPCQNITAVAAANQFYSNQVIAGLSNKSIQVFDTNAEKVGLTIPFAHSKAVTCIRINEAPRGSHATELCDYFMTSCFSNFDPIKLWDLRTAKCVLRISDINPSAFVPSTRPALSPCGRYIASGFEDNSLVLYDVRKINSRVLTFKGMKSSVLDCCFDMNVPMIWCGCRNGSFWNFYTQQ